MIRYVEALSPSCPQMREAEKIYESSYPGESVLPWGIFMHLLEQRLLDPSLGATFHMILAIDVSNEVCGVSCGLDTGYFGYAICFCVREDMKRKGVGKKIAARLFDHLFLDSLMNSRNMNFIAWDCDSGGKNMDLYRARRQFFKSLGAWKIEGVEIVIPDPEEVPSRQAVFVLPVNKAPQSFDKEFLESIVKGIMEMIYGQDDKVPDESYKETFKPGYDLSLEPIAD